ncbi:MAG TPA: histone deacetylase family protein [Thermodesulfobacteriota bacterium]|nr:histone deacetylase family protein [Thermodesulfobacteriota bacterium]
MNIIFHEKFYETYDADPAAAPGRMEPIMRELKKYPHYKFIVPEPAKPKDILRAHSAHHIEHIKEDSIIYDMAILAAGGAIKAAELAYGGEPSFACIRPPGHHASYDSCWGFCFFNNMSVSLLKLEAEGKIKSAFILDFDLHTGDGNINILGKKPGFSILNPRSSQEEDYLEEIFFALRQAGEHDIIAASAGFDEYIHDWGHKLSTNAYREIGKMMKAFSEKHCYGRRYALLEGGYCYEDLGINIHAFCEGFR